MERSEFLREISSMRHEEIQRVIKDKEKIHKKILPAVYVIHRDKNPTPGSSGSGKKGKK